MSGLVASWGLTIPQLNSAFEQMNAMAVRFNASDIPVVARIDKPVEPRVVDELAKRFVDFRRASSEDGLSVAEFDSFAPTRRTLRQFIAATAELSSMVRDVLVPDPAKA